MAKVLGDRILVKVLPKEGTTAGGIVLPDIANRGQIRGEVIQIGPGGYQMGVLIPLTVKVGDVVIFADRAGTEITLDNQQCTILNENSILAIL